MSSRRKISGIVLSLLLMVAAIWISADRIFLFLSDADTAQLPTILIKPLLLLVCLVPLNWYFETMKWQMLSRSKDMRWSASSVLRGLNTALVTPNRIGEVVGRVWKSGNDKAKHTHAFIIGSLAQSTVTVAFGICGLLMFGLGSAKGIQRTELIAISLIALFAMLGISLWLGSSGISVLKRINWPEKFQKHLHSLERIPFSTQLKALYLSLLRYLIFSTQYLLALYAFGASAEILTLLPGIMVVYLISSVIPASIIGELGVRESVAIIVLGSICDPLTILAATLCVWLFNLVLPALAGSVIWFKESLN